MAEPLRRILFVYNDPAPFIRLDLEELRKRYEVTEFYLRSRRPNPFAIWRAVRNHDLVFGWFASWHTWLPMEFAKLMGKPAVLVIGGYDLANMPNIDYGHQRGGLKKWISRRAMRSASCLITNSQYSRGEAARNTMLSEEQVRAVYHGVPDPFKALPQGARERMALTVGKVDRSNLTRKGHEAFVRTAALMPDVNFVLAGAWADDAVDYLRSIATPNVTLTNRLSDAELDDYYRRASVYVQPSMHEGFGMSVAEAMLAGCVPVVTRVGALSEVVGNSGVFVGDQSPDAIAAGIAKALTYPEEARANIRQRILEEFPLETRGAVLQQVVNSFLTPINDITSAADADTSADLPFVSVIVPVRNEANFIERSLGAVIAQDYPSERMEVIVADGLSTDSTRQLVAALANCHRNVRLIDNPGKIVSTGINAALEIARGEIIVRVDGHTLVSPDYCRQCVEALQKSGADNVGGRMTAISDGAFGRAVALATSSRFGIGNGQFHYSERVQLVDTVYLGAWPRDVFRRVGMFDEEMVRNQDDEFNYRLRAAGGEIQLNPLIKSQYYNRASIRSLWRQYFQYGFWKVRVLQKHPMQMMPRQFVPPTLVVALLASLLVMPLTPLGKLPLLTVGGLYLIAALAASINAARKNEWTLLALLPVSFATLHLSYGLGFLFGLVKFWNRWGDRQTRVGNSAALRDAASL